MTLSLFSNDSVEFLDDFEDIDFGDPTIDDNGYDDAEELSEDDFWQY